VAGGYSFILYVQLQNFTLQASGAAFILHLRYDWSLYTEGGERVPVPQWESRPPADKEDRIVLQARLRQRFQFWRLPLPERLPAGKYRLKVAVEDAAAKRRAVKDVPIEVAE
jgi:hypothetical protein